VALSRGNSPASRKVIYAAALVTMLLLVGYVVGLAHVMLASLAVEIDVYLAMPYVAVMGTTLHREAHAAPMILSALRDGLVVEFLTVILMMGCAAVTVAMQSREASVVRVVDHVRAGITARLSMESTGVV
jgi:hypothetical protein